MPTYDYLCEKCNKKTEIFHGINDEKDRFCKKCKSKMKKQIGSGCGIIFNGPGFYETDYKEKK